MSVRTPISEATGILIRDRLPARVGLSTGTMVTTAVRATLTIAAVLIPYFWWAANDPQEPINTVVS